jgi:hypothetical protein
VVVTGLVVSAVTGPVVSVVAVVVVVDVVDAADDGAEPPALSSPGATFCTLNISQFPSAHSYPWGQHSPLPQLPSFTSNTVVLIGARGFCKFASQGIGAIVLHKAPSGQQTTVVLAASQMHWVPMAQQKLGRPAEGEPQAKTLPSQAMVIALACHFLG